MKDRMQFLKIIKIRFKEGMIVSNEPGYYENGKFGIRIENLLRVKKTKNGNFFDEFNDGSNRQVYDK